MFFSAGMAEWLRGRRRNFLIIGAVGAASLVSIYVFNRAFYYRAGFMSFGGTIPAPLRAGLGAPIAWLPGNPLKNMVDVLLDPEKGLLPYTPILIICGWALHHVWRRQRYLCSVILWCIIPWAIVHLSYQYLMVGESYTVRYLVPIVPMLMLALPFWTSATHRGSSRILYRVLCGWSIACNAIAGVLPALSFSHRPFTMFRGVIKIIFALAVSRFN
jgi:hypothetical protein